MVVKIDLEVEPTCSQPNATICRYYQSNVCLTLFTLIGLSNQGMDHGSYMVASKRRLFALDAVITTVSVMSKSLESRPFGSLQSKW